MLKEAAETVTLAVLGVSSSGTSAIGLATMSAEKNGTILSTETWIPLGLFLAGIAMTATVVWKVAAHKTSTDAKITALEDKVSVLENAKKNK